MRKRRFSQCGHSWVWNGNWIKFGWFWGAKINEHFTKIEKNNISYNTFFLTSIFLDFGFQFGSLKDLKIFGQRFFFSIFFQRCAQEAPKTFPRRPKTPPRGPKMPPRRAKMSPKTTQVTPQRLQEAPKMPQDPAKTVSLPFREGRHVPVAIFLATGISCEGDGTPRSPLFWRPAFLGRVMARRGRHFFGDRHFLGRVNGSEKSILKST